jgi:hypothetical protein
MIAVPSLKNSMVSALPTPFHLPIISLSRFAASDIEEVSNIRLATNNNAYNFLILNPLPN